MPAIRCSCGSLTSTKHKACKSCGAAIEAPAAPAPAVSEAKRESDTVEPRRCPDCAELATARKACEYCGHKFREARRCPDCAEITSSPVCEHCGHDGNARSRAVWDQHRKLAAQHDTADTLAMMPGIFGLTGKAMKSSLPELNTSKTYFQSRNRRK